MGRAESKQTAVDISYHFEQLTNLVILIIYQEKPARHACVEVDGLADKNSSNAARLEFDLISKSVKFNVVFIRLKNVVFIYLFSILNKNPLY